MENKIYNIEESIKVQKEYQQKTGSPDFAPSTGICWKCKRNIYGENGISVEEARTQLVTGCPFCHRSYCE